MEPFGELEYAEVDEEVSPTGVTEHSVLWTRNNPLLRQAFENTDAPCRLGVAGRFGSCDIWGIRWILVAGSEARYTKSFFQAREQFSADRAHNGA